MKNRRKQNFEGEANNIQLEKKILDEATRIVNVFLISWLFYLFSLCSISLLYKERFHIAVWSLSKSIRASSFIENFPQISAKPIAFQRNLHGKLPWNRPFFTNHFSAKLASKIPAKFPRNWPFFPRICPWNPAKFDFFSRDLPEALTINFCCAHNFQVKQTSRNKHFKFVVK